MGMNITIMSMTPSQAGASSWVGIAISTTMKLWNIAIPINLICIIDTTTSTNLWADKMDLP